MYDYNHIFNLMLTRLHQYVQFKKLSLNQFELSLEVSHGSISNAIKNNKGIGSKVIQKILDTYPELSAEWLLRGSGSMLLNNNEQILEHNSLLAHKHDLANGQAQELIRQIELASLSAWEKKYGLELKIIKQQLMTLFTAKLDSEKSVNNELGPKSKIR